MIADALSNSPLYQGLSPRIARAFDWLRGTDLQRAATGTFEIDGPRVFALVQEYETIPPGRAAWEAHRQHIDLQCVVCGTERIGYARADRLLAGAYDPGRDLLPLVGTGDFLTLGAGEFMILFPQDAHMPRVAVGATARVRKVVVKIAIAP